MDKKDLDRLVIKMNVPPERQAAFKDRVWLIWADRVEQLVIAAEAEGFPQVNQLLTRIKNG